MFMNQQELMKYTDEKIKEIRSKLELDLWDLDMDLTYLKHGVIPYNEDRNYRDVFMDKDLIFDQIRIVDRELRRRGYTNWIE